LCRKKEKSREAGKEKGAKVSKDRIEPKTDAKPKQKN